MAQSAKDYLRSEKNRILDEASKLTEKAEEEGRSLATEEKEKVKSLLAAAEDKQTRIDEIEENEQIREAIDRVNGPVNRGTVKAPASASTLGEAFVNSDGYRGLMSMSSKSGKWTTGAVEFETKAPGAGTLSGVNSEISFTDQRPGVIPVSLRRLTVSELLAQGTTTSNSITYRQEQSGSAGSVNAAAAVAEGGLKPTSRIRAEVVTEPVRKIATILEVTDEMLEDEAQIRSFIDSRLRTYIAMEEEDQLLNGSGTPPNISGILDRDIQTGTQASLGDTPLDAVFGAITAIRLANEEPTGIVVNPSDWEIFRLSKDLNEQYYGGGPFTGAYGNSGGIAANNLWGLPVVVTAAIAEGTLLVGAFATAAQIFRRSGVSVEATNSHGDNFAYDVTALRAETRLALAVYKLDAFYAITSVEAVSA